VHGPFHHFFVPVGVYTTTGPGDIPGQSPASKEAPGETPGPP
jgi:hypothetical protein